MILLVRPQLTTLTNRLEEFVRGLMLRALIRLLWAVFDV